MKYGIKTDKGIIVERYSAEELPDGYTEITEEENSKIVDLCDHQYKYDGEVKEIK